MKNVDQTKGINQITNNPKETAKLLNIHPSTVYRHLAENKQPTKTTNKGAK